MERQATSTLTAKNAIEDQEDYDAHDDCDRDRDLEVVDIPRLRATCQEILAYVERFKSIP